MQMEEKLEKMSERLGALEHQYDSDKKVVKVGAAVFAFLLIAFFGISLRQIKSKVDAAMEGEAVKTSEKKAEESAKKAEESAKKAEESEAEAKMKLRELEKKLKENQSASENGYAWIGNIKLVWGKRKSTGKFQKRELEKFGFDPNPNTNGSSKYSFKECFIVIPSVPGVVEVSEINETGFSYRRGNEFGPREFTFVAIGN